MERSDIRRTSGIGSVLVVGAALLVGIVVLYVLLHSYMLGNSPSAASETGGAGAEVSVAHAASSASAAEFIGYSDSLDERTFEKTRVGGLSALTYDPRRDLYYALVDREEGTPARFYTLRLPLDDGSLSEPEVFDVTSMRDSKGRPFGAGRLDGEGLALTPWGDLLVASEIGPSIYRFSHDGRLLQDLPVPRRFLTGSKGAQPNNSFEGLSLTPDGHSLYVALQKPLAADDSGAPDQKQRIRILRYDVRELDAFQPSEEFFYLTDSPGGIADIAAVSRDELLILEHGNKVFRADLQNAENVSDEDSLADSVLKPLEKKLVADLDACVTGHGAGSDHRSGTPAETYEYEGMTLGQPLPDERQALMVVSDDNFDKEQLTRVLALGVAPQGSSEKAADSSCQPRSG